MISWHAGGRDSDCAMVFMHDPLAVALFTTCYNFVRIHKTLRVTPAMAASVTDKLWEIGDVVKVAEESEEAL
jgi:hypothetical protein